MGNTEESFQKEIEEIEEDGAGGVKNFVEILRRMENGTEGWVRIWWITLRRM